MANEFARLDATNQVRRDAGDQSDLAVFHGGQHHHRTAELRLQPIDDAAQRLGIRTIDTRRQQLDTGHFNGLRRKIAALATGELGLELLHFLFEATGTFQQRLHLLGNVFASTANELRHRLEPLLIRCHSIQRTLPSDRFDTAHARSDTRFCEQFEQADIARAGHVRATTQFSRTFANAEHANFAFVFLTKKTNGTGGDGVFVGHDTRLRRTVRAHFEIHPLLDARQLRRRHALEVAEVETETVRGDERPLLLHMGTQHFAQRSVQQVRGGMVAARGVATLYVNRRFQTCPHFKGTTRQMPNVCVLLAHLHGVADGELGSAGQQQAGVAHLTAALGVERGLVQHHLAGFARFQTLHLRPIANKSHDRASGCGVFIATEINAAFQLHGIAQVYAELAGGTRTVALCFHGGREAGFVDGEAAFTRYVRGEVHGKTVGVVQLEDRLTGDGDAFHGSNDAFEQGHAIDQRFGEPLFFLAQHPSHMVASRAQFRVGLAHDSVEIRHQVREEWLRLAQLVAMTNGATNDAT